MHYTLMSAVDRRDGVTALWLLRRPAGAQEFQECAYLGATPRPKDIGRHVSQIKRTTFARPEFYVFENMQAWVVHVDHSAAHSTTKLDEWEVMA
ncbi:hypothetical protein SIPHO4S_00006 [Serratia phage Tsm2]|uniref:Uncharacterized protein n=1 Tax=Serratia phage Tsm2 TaxID=2787014 RepID=A0A7S9XD80_9CAUD|nr:hypothetical protein PF629_gp06 [Serratia phage Tsm2]QPI13702.1 hypothetical protein SIPHO4S_00006 [Serratia phage Tsm2]